MDATASCLAFADGEYTFFLPMARLVAAEREMGCSIFELFFNLGQNLVEAGDSDILSGPSPARLTQCRALIRNALIGGGEPEQTAAELVETYCFPARAAILDAALAFHILRAMIYGVDTKPAKKKPGAAKRSSPSEKAK